MADIPFAIQKSEELEIEENASGRMGKSLTFSIPYSFFKKKLVARKRKKSFPSHRRNESLVENGNHFAFTRS